MSSKVKFHKVKMVNGDVFKLLNDQHEKLIRNKDVIKYIDLETFISKNNKEIKTININNIISISPYKNKRTIM